MAQRFVSVVIFAVILLIGSCRKDRDEFAPTVRIVDPAGTFDLGVPDTLLVRIEVSDERSVEWLNIALLDGNGVPAVPVISVHVNSVSSTVARALPIVSERLSTGPFSLEVTASDGTNESRAFRTVNVSSAPLRLRALYIAPPIGYPAPATIWRIDSTGSLSQYTALSEFGGAAIDADRLYLAGTVNQALQGIAQTSGGSGISIPNLNVANATIPFFLGLCVDPGDGRTYFGTNEGFIRGLSAGGTQTFTALSPVDLRSQFTAVVGDLLASVARHRVLDTWYLVTHTLPSGSVLGQFVMDLEPVALQALDGQLLFLFGNRNGVGVVQERSVLHGGGSDLMIFNEGPISAVARLNAGAAIIAVPGRLLRYSAFSNSTTVVAQGFTAQSLAYDDASGILHVGVGHELLAIDPVTGATSVVSSFPHPVGMILPLLNR